MNEACLSRVIVITTYIGELLSLLPVFMTVAIPFAYSGARKDCTSIAMSVRVVG